MYVAFECFMLQVQTTGVGAMRVGWAKPRPPTCGGGAGHHRRCGEEAQTALCCCGRGGGESSGRPGRDGRRAGVEEAGASHLSSVGSGSDAGGSDASAGNGVGAGDARIRADGAEQPLLS